MPIIPTTKFHSDCLIRNIKFIVGNDDVIALNLVEICQRFSRSTGFIHITTQCCNNERWGINANANTKFSDVRSGFMRSEFHSGNLRHMGSNHRANIVSSFFILRTGIT